MRTRPLFAAAVRSAAAVLGITGGLGGLLPLVSTRVAAEVNPAQTFPALGAPDDPKVRVSWDHFNDVAGLTQILRDLNAAYPDLSEFIVLGRSVEGREITGLRVTNERQGNPDTKPAMYIDGNIHGNEVQAGETVAYTAWYLLENYGKVDRVTRLLDEKEFFLVPTINPDGRDHWFHDPANPHNFRGGMIPIDEDGDGLFDEDGPDDMDGDGQITRMRIADPWGRWKPDPDYPDFLMVEVDRDERGTYTLLGQEGFDNDGDGEINEDDPGGYDPNRNWPWLWQPEGIQYGAHDYPFSLPETKAVGDFVLAHPNIAAAQTYHHNGGMILRSPGSESARMERADDDLFAFIGERGESMLPGYHSYVLWKDLYQVWGGELDWSSRCARCRTASPTSCGPEENLYRKDLGEGEKDASAARRSCAICSRTRAVLNEIDHPDYEKVEGGGTAKVSSGRVPPSFLLEEELHRNMAFTLTAEAMPLILDHRGGGGERGRQRTLAHPGRDRQPGIIPTRLHQDVRHEEPTGQEPVQVEGVRVLAAGRFLIRTGPRCAGSTAGPSGSWSKPWVDSSRTWVEFLVAGSGNARIRVDALRGGTAERTVSVP
ncbi:MAG: M14 family metallopeptidase [Candidatus Eisenbacteria bacterium]